MTLATLFNRNRYSTFLVSKNQLCLISSKDQHDQQKSYFVVICRICRILYTILVLFLLPNRLLVLYLLLLLWSRNKYQTQPSRFATWWIANCSRSRPTWPTTQNYATIASWFTNLWSSNCYFSYSKRSKIGTNGSSTFLWRSCQVLNYN